MAAIESIYVDSTYNSSVVSTAQPILPTPANKAKKEPVVELKNIHKTYLLGLEGVPALRGVSLTVNHGEWVIIFGTSGGGKTSLLNIIGTIDKPTKGEMKICGETIRPKTKDDVLANIRLSKLGFVFQTFNLLSSMTAVENVELPMTLKGIHSAGTRRKLAEESLKRVGLEHRIDHFPSQLSGGEQQRVTIARATANNPELLLLDEPTGDLDTSNSHKIIDLLIKLNTEQKMTMVMVTHDMALKNFAHRVVWMRDGKISKIEEICPEKRLKAIQDLSIKLKKYYSAKGHKSNPSSASAGQSAESTSQANHSRGTHTKIRKAEDYATAVFASIQLKSKHPATQHISPLSDDSGLGTSPGAPSSSM